MEQEEQKNVTDPQQDEMNGNILQKPFEELFGNSKKEQPSEEEIKQVRPLTEEEKGQEEKNG